MVSFQLSSFHATAAAAPPPFLLMLAPVEAIFSPLVKAVIILRAAAGWSIGTICPAPKTRTKLRAEPSPLTCPAGAAASPPSSRLQSWKSASSKS